MTKKHWAYLALGLGVLMIWALSKLKAGTVDTSTTIGKLQSDLASLSLAGSTATGAAAGSATATTPWVAYGLLGVGAWLLWA